jgi:hypothetical protein
MAEHLSMKIDDAKDQAKEAAECKQETEAYLAKIKKLIEDAGGDDDNEADDKAAQELAAAAEKQA